MQRKMSQDLKKRLMLLECKNSKDDKKLVEYAKGHHRKTNSDAHKYGVCDLQRKAPVDEGKKQTVAATLHKPKGSLEDYVAKKAQYKLRRAKKVQSSTSYGGQGSGDSRFQSHGSSGGIPKKDFLAATIDVRQTIVSKISMRHNGGTGALSPRLGTKDSSKHTIATTISAGGTVPPRAAWMIQPLDRPFVSGQPEGEENCDTTALYIEDDSETGLEQKPERVQKGPPQRLVLQGRKETAALNLSGSSISSTGIVRHSACGHYNYSTGFMGEKCVLRSHMDSVRDVQFSCGLNYLVTASEDCMVKLWDIKGLKKNGILHPSRIEPCFSYRGHTGPLFAVCVGNGLQKEDHFIYSAGSEGIIRIWGIPSIESSKYPPTNGKNFCVGVWTSHRDVVWQLVHHPTEGLLLSVSADGTVKMWKEFDISQLVDSVDKSTALRRCVMVDSNDCLLGAFVMRNTSQQYYEIPTSAAWLTGSHSGLLISYGKNKGLLKFELNPHLKSTEQQVNRVIAHPSLPLAFTAHENGIIRVFDVSSSIRKRTIVVVKQVKTLYGHSGGIAAATMLNSEPYLLTGGCDGSVKVWDLRKYQPVFELSAHNRKYGEGVCAIAAHSQMPFVATAGADGTAKVYVYSL